MGSEFLKLVKSDIVRALIVAFFAAFINFLAQFVNIETFAVNWDALVSWATYVSALKYAGGAALAYLLKNYFTNSQGQVFKPEQKQIDKL